MKVEVSLLLFSDSVTNPTYAMQMEEDVVSDHDNILMSFVRPLLAKLGTRTYSTIMVS